MAAISRDAALRAGALSVGLVPGLGGSVSHFRFAGIDLMRPLSDADRLAGNVLGVAMFPMTPYANRIAGNAFAFGGRTWRFAPNNTAEKYNVHGTGWHRPWTLKLANAAEAVLTLAIKASREAYSYWATQRFLLTEGGLTVAMSLTNAGPVAMPFGFGLHPWFERDNDVTLQFSAKRYYLEEPDGVSGDPVTLPPELDFAEARPLPGGWRNNNYGGWDGVATLRYPSRGAGLTIRADAVFGHLMLYADPTKPYFCVEQQSNASGAFNRAGGFADPDEGVIVLAPGETAEGSVRFEPFRL